MRIFDFLRKKPTLSQDEQKWNRMWDLWTEGKAESPYAELMEYESEVNNGGHCQYFFNVANCGDLKASVERLLPILPTRLKDNMKRGYEAFCAQEDLCDDEENEALLEECDDVFYENEQLVTDLLKEYANRMEL